MKILRTIPFLTVLLLFVPISKAQHTVTLRWQPSSTAGATYIVYRETAAGICPATSTGTVVTGCLKLTPGGVAGIVTPCLNSTASCLSFVDLNPPQGATSFYVVRAFAGGVESVNSNEITAVVPLPPATPPAPASNLTATVN
jgi:hypothetical protein